MQHLCFYSNCWNNRFFEDYILTAARYINDTIWILSEKVKCQISSAENNFISLIAIPQTLCSCCKAVHYSQYQDSIDSISILSEIHVSVTLFVSRLCNTYKLTLCKFNVSLNNYPVVNKISSVISNVFHILNKDYTFE